MRASLTIFLLWSTVLLVEAKDCRMKNDIKRLFFGLEVNAPWPEKLPVGRLLDPTHRHMTLAFLGNIPFSPLKALLANFPKPAMRVGLVGHFSACLTLPHRHPNVVAWQAHWSNESIKIISFQKTLVDWLLQQHFAVDAREWLPHVTLCRKPFDPHAWKKTFASLPFYTGSIHLYESKGHLTYDSIWTYPLQIPFEEIEHTADIAFNIYGESLLQLYQHAFTALAFKYPPLLNFYLPQAQLADIDDLVIALNAIICQADKTTGCPFKAVSFHGEVMACADAIFKWEMIVDV